jgi:hypothetical protein
VVEALPMPPATRSGAPSATPIDDLPLDAETLAAPVGRFHAWWRGDPLPSLPALPGLTIAPAGEERLLARLTALDETEIARRRRRGHLPWLARIDDQPVGWGWCAREEVAIGELGLIRSLPPGNRYLWDCFTLPGWRGRGIYPRLLQTMVTCETNADRFWLGHDFTNVASARGIARSGFREVGILYRRPTGAFVLLPSAPLSIAAAAATLFAVALATPSPYAQEHSPLLRWKAGEEGRGGRQGAGG